MPTIVLVSAAVGALLGLLAGPLAPRIMARIPEPEPEPDAEPGPTKPPKVLYADLAARPGVAWRCSVGGAISGALLGGGVAWVGSPGAWAAVPALIYLLPVGLALAVVDWHTRLLPTKVIAPSYAVVVLLLVVGALAVGEPRLLIATAVGWAVYGGLFFLLWFIYPRGMGYGDVRLSGLLGLVLGTVGLPQLLLGVEAGFLLGAFGGLLLSAVGKADRRAYPFGPFMLVGAVVGVAFGVPVLAALLL